jgi:Amt family ammonium transporter
MRFLKSILRSGFFLLPFLLPTLAFGQDTIDTGDTAWILTSSALVLFMTIPGLSLFYAGLVRSRNVLSVLMHCFVLTAMMSLIWLVVGYSMAFSTAGMEAGTVGWNSFVGGFDKVFLKGISADSPWGSIPEPLFFVFQMTFFIITPALIVGAFAERMKFSAMLWFMAVWSVLVYLPVCHMVWGGGGGFFADMGVIDFAGGIVVHITAGVAALVACIVVGKRQDYPKKQILPHNLPMTVTGAGMLWVGWFGFNGGSALGANGDAAMAILVTHISASSGALGWMILEWRKSGRPSVLGIATGSIAGLAAITPASGSVGPLGAVVIGFVSTGLCYWMCTVIKSKFRYDDSLDVFGVHGVGGFVGTILVAVFAAPSLGGRVEGLVISKQLGVQLFAGVSVAVYTLIVSFVILKVLQKTIGLRVSENDERGGLDLNSHGESAYND